MMAFFTLVRREYLQYRPVFLYAPLILIAIVTALTVAALVSGHTRFAVGGNPVGYRVFDSAYFVLGGLWWAYLFIALFFYFADSFNSDWRDNSMLFWKSMPVSDYAVLMSKLVAGMTVLPAMVFIALLVTGIIAGLATLVAPHILPLLGPANVGAIAVSWMQISFVALLYLVLALLWYAPFFAWVGALSTAFGRWSIPLALLIPVVFSAFEGAVDLGAAPGGSYILGFLRQRLSFNFDTVDLEIAVLSGGPIDITGLAGRLISAVNWPSLIAGLLFAAAVIYLASRYRRRVLKSFA